ncbi:hypothetical protein SISNIDRAFT_343335 [Sistotremastrum niveocremeum HHB9708]|uniref:Uncharacterized protein n=1 Tax=Sistotremastrum niveocremeum HHB9708 TaxID=1314777 RepID=A0A164MLV9_9AGAM|nr:hypothetical protein SISNIDRAFT_343335 [Sistotremastrum niveocremeum HHB9708]
MERSPSRSSRKAVCGLTAPGPGSRPLSTCAFELKRPVCLGRMRVDVDRGWAELKWQRAEESRWIEDRVNQLYVRCSSLSQRTTLTLGLDAMAARLDTRYPIPSRQRGQRIHYAELR